MFYIGFFVLFFSSHSLLPKRKFMKILHSCISTQNDDSNLSIKLKLDDAKKCFLSCKSIIKKTIKIPGQGF